MTSRPIHYNTRYKHDLNPRQCEVLNLISRGWTNAEIAEGLGLSLDGAKWHVRAILAKLGCSSREEAAAWWADYNRPAVRLGRTVRALLAPGILKFAGAVSAGAVTIGAVAVAVFIVATSGTDDGRADTAPTVTPAVDVSAHTYRVVPGDTVFGIARVHGITADALLQANPGLDLTNLVVDQLLQIPSPPGVPVVSCDSAAIALTLRQEDRGTSMLLGIEATSLTPCLLEEPLYVFVADASGRPLDLAGNQVYIPTGVWLPNDQLAWLEWSSWCAGGDGYQFRMSPGEAKQAPFPIRGAPDCGTAGMTSSLTVLGRSNAPPPPPAP